MTVIPKNNNLKQTGSDCSTGQSFLVINGGLINKGKLDRLDIK